MLIDAQCRLDYTHGAAAPYKGLDRFGRVVDHQWFDTAASTDRDRVKYGYDRNSNRTWRQNTLASGQDAFYTYDVLDRLTNVKRGTLTGTAPNYTGVTAPTFAQDWTLSILGNWDSFTQDNNGDGSGGWDLAQNRSHNPANETTVISAYIGPDWADPAHAAACNPVGAHKTTRFTILKSKRASKIVTPCAHNTPHNMQP